jgi:hypothetical protein
MNVFEARNFVEIELAKRIRNKMNCIYDLLYMTSEEKFSLLKELSLLITELLSTEETKKKFIALANSSKVKENSENNDIKFKTFEIIRHIVIHFPFFKKWDDVFITNALLNWNDKENQSIQKFLKCNIDKEITYMIYTNPFDKWEPTHPVTMKVLPINDDNPVFMKDMISENDVIWTFGLIDHYLDFMGFGLETYSSTSL